jgi:hypothetical protein
VIPLLAGLIDHAPTFPPAQLPVDEALAEDRRVRASDDAWIAGRLVWPGERLHELDGYAHVPLSLVLAGPVPVPGTRTWPVEAVEARWPHIPAFGGEVFVEVPIDDSLQRNLARVKQAGAFAKVRCGGERTPSAAELARFVRACAELELPFKASAGLHHALPSGGGHGFLNLLAAASRPDDAEALLADEHLSYDEIAAVDGLRERFRSFGSCSFAEPVAELRELGIL